MSNKWLYCFASCGAGCYLGSGAGSPNRLPKNPIFYGHVSAHSVTKKKTPPGIFLRIVHSRAGSCCAVTALLVLCSSIAMAPATQSSPSKVNTRGRFTRRPETRTGEAEGWSYAASAGGDGCAWCACDSGDGERERLELVRGRGSGVLGVPRTWSILTVLPLLCVLSPPRLATTKSRLGGKDPRTCNGYSLSKRVVLSDTPKHKQTTNKQQTGSRADVRSTSTKRKTR